MWQALYVARFLSSLLYAYLAQVVFDEDELCSLLDVTTLLSADDDEVPVHTIDVLHHAPDSSINPLLPHIAHHPSLMDAFHPDTPEPEFEFETEIEIGCIDALNPRNVTPEKENQVQLQEEIPYSPAAATFNSLRSSNELYVPLLPPISFFQLTPSL
jgi:hypothetical protein